MSHLSVVFLISSSVESSIGWLVCLFILHKSTRLLSNPVVWLESFDTAVGRELPTFLEMIEFSKKFDCTLLDSSESLVSGNFTSKSLPQHVSYFQNSFYFRDFRCIPFMPFILQSSLQKRHKSAVTCPTFI